MKADLGMNKQYQVGSVMM